MNLKKKKDAYSVKFNICLELFESSNWGYVMQVFKVQIVSQLLEFLPLPLT